jgi:hypothetical protein
MILFSCGFVLIVMATLLVLSGNIAFGLSLYMLGGALVAFGVLS